MNPPDRPVPSAVWLWGFWLYAVPAVAAFVLSLTGPASTEHLLRSIAGGLLILAGLHQLAVVDYKRATRGPYSTFDPYAYLVQRQTGRTAIVVGAFFVLTALLGF